MLTKKISNWMIAAAIILGVAALTPSDVQAQGGTFCQTCDNFTGECTTDGRYLNDRCYQGQWGGVNFCASWGRLWCDPRIAFDDVGADGALLRERSFAAASPDAPAVPQSASEHVRDCRSRIVARSYGTNEAEEMRRRTESIVI
ncbi:hypothetical protein [Candidatus Palauibacter sp.]|uniref:hypothetical protein n=1 Tax=Candidatus Palauibacter sp. TaxID=3101350 RepID=UPI003CC57F90